MKAFLAFLLNKQWVNLFFTASTLHLWCLLCVSLTLTPLWHCSVLRFWKVNAEMWQETVITMVRHNPVVSSFIVCHVPWMLLTQTLLRNGFHSEKSKGLKYLVLLFVLVIRMWNFPSLATIQGIGGSSLISDLISACWKLMSWVSSTSVPPKGTSNSTGSL